jgi:hypothetical protein
MLKSAPPEKLRKCRPTLFGGTRGFEGSGSCDISPTGANGKQAAGRRMPLGSLVSVGPDGRRKYPVNAGYLAGPTLQLNSSLKITGQP